MNQETKKLPLLAATILKQAFKSAEKQIGKKIKIAHIAIVENKRQNKYVYFDDTEETLPVTESGNNDFYKSFLAESGLDEVLKMSIKIDMENKTISIDGNGKKGTDLIVINNCLTF